MMAPVLTAGPGAAAAAATVSNHSKFVDDPLPPPLSNSHRPTPEKVATTVTPLGASTLSLSSTHRPWEAPASLTQTRYPSASRVSSMRDVDRSAGTSTSMSTVVLVA